VVERAAPSRQAHRGATRRQARRRASLVKLAGSLDLTGEDTLSKIDAHLAKLPLAALDPYLKQIPLRFEGDSLGTFDIPLTLKGWEIDWKPAMLLDRIEARARQPDGKIAGFEAERVATEVTNAGRVLIDSIRIHGPIWAPTIEGDVETVKALVLEGGKAYAAKQATKLLDEQKAKLLEKNPALQKKLKEAGVERILEGGGDAAKDAAGKALDFLGGGKKK
jgi:hypothetical protein